jgi:hypothetical protein
MEPSAVAPLAIDATARWLPMAFGDRAPALVPNPLFEPLWPGRRAIVEISRRGVTVRDVDLGLLAGGPGLLAAIATATLADESVVDGYIVQAPLDRVATSTLDPAASAKLTMREILRQGLLGGLGQNPSREAAKRPRPAREPLPMDGPIGFVAVDLLWVDGQALLDVPLGERKRLLESVIAEGELVQKIVPVLAPVERWHGRWRALGFKEVAVKGMNSRYQPGGVSADWTIAAVPR